MRGEWQALYRFDLQRQHLIDDEVSSYDLSTNPTSHVVTGLIAARAEPGRRLALRGRDLAIHASTARPPGARLPRRARSSR